MQFRYLIFGLLLAAIFVGINWANSQPGIPPVRLPGEQLRVADTPNAEARRSEDKAEERFSLDGDPEPGSQTGGDAIVLPALNDSDGWLRTQLAETALPWLAETELVRTGATVLENASRGELPRKFLGFLAPKGTYKVYNMGELIQIDPSSYERYSPFVKNLQRLSPERAAEMFRLAEPLLAEAVKELGREGVTPRELAYEALSIALDTPRVDASTALKQPKVIYTYADKDLEDLKPLQKQLLRMGPENFHTVRLWLEDFGLALTPDALYNDGPATDDRMATDALEQP